MASVRVCNGIAQLFSGPLPCHTVIQAGVDCNAVKPGRERAVTPETREGPECLEERLLH